jgi:hypothetical protein
MKTLFRVYCNDRHYSTFASYREASQCAERFDNATIQPEAALHRIDRLFSAIDATLFTIHPKLDYDGTIKAIAKLADMVHAYDGDSDQLWEIGEFGCAPLDSLLIGAYWFLADYHGGQDSSEYAALSAIGQVFSPGMTAGPEPDSSEETAYSGLEILCPHSDRTEF